MDSPYLELLAALSLIVFTAWLARQVGPEKKVARALKRKRRTPVSLVKEGDRARGTTALGRTHPGDRRDGGEAGIGQRSSQNDSVGGSYA